MAFSHTICIPITRNGGLHPGAKASPNISLTIYQKIMVKISIIPICSCHKKFEELPGTVAVDLRLCLFPRQPRKRLLLKLWMSSNAVYRHIWYQNGYNFMLNADLD